MRNRRRAPMPPSWQTDTAIGSYSGPSATLPMLRSINACRKNVESPGAPPPVLSAVSAIVIGERPSSSAAIERRVDAQMCRR